jgi:hypothetical protein
MSKINFFDQIRERHHSAARLFAAGHSASDVARLMGASERQLERQASDPAFRQLVSRYRAVDDAPNANQRFQTYAVAA